MPYLTVGKEKGANIETYYKDWDMDWGKGQPMVFSHDWPLSSDATTLKNKVNEELLAFIEDRQISRKAA